MLAHSIAQKRQVTLTFPGTNQAKVARPAAHIDDEATHPRLHAIRFLRSMRTEPRIKRRLRFFEQNDVLQPCVFCGVGRQISRDIIERCRNGDRDELLFEPLGGRLRFRMIPCIDEVAKILCRGFERGYPNHIRRRCPRQQRRGAIDPRMAQPRLRR